MLDYITSCSLSDMKKGLYLLPGVKQLLYELKQRRYHNDSDNDNNDNDNNDNNNDNDSDTQVVVGLVTGNLEVLL